MSFEINIFGGNMSTLNFSSKKYLETLKSLEDSNRNGDKCECQKNNSIF